MGFGFQAEEKAEMVKITKKNLNSPLGETSEKLQSSLHKICIY